MMTVGIKYCGNCNPSTDMPGLIKKLAEEAPWLSFTHWDSEGSDITLVLHGCRCACTDIPAKAGRVLEITSDTIDFRPIDKQDLKEAVMEKLTKLRDEISDRTVCDNAR